MSILNYFFKEEDTKDTGRLTTLLNKFVTQLNTVLDGLRPRKLIEYTFTTAAVVTNTPWTQINTNGMAPSGLVILSTERPNTPNPAPHTQAPGFDWRVEANGFIQPYGGYGWQASTYYKCLLEIVGNG